MNNHFRKVPAKTGRTLREMVVTGLNSKEEHVGPVCNLLPGCETPH